MATRGEDLDLAILYALQRLGSEAMTLKLSRCVREVRVRGEGHFRLAADGFWQVCATKLYPSCLM